MLLRLDVPTGRTQRNGGTVQTGIGKRGFVQEYGVLLCVLAKHTKGPAVVRGELYLNWKSGIALRRPPDWQFWRPENPDRVRGNQLSNWGLSLAELNEDLGPPYPLVAAVNPVMRKELIASGADDVKELAVGFQVATEAVYAVTGRISSLSDHVDQDLRVFRQGLREYELLTKPRSGSLSRCEAVEYTGRYLWEHRNVPKRVPVWERVIYVAGR